MTPTQLQEMSDRELVEHVHRVATPYETTGDLLIELARRIDDRYPFHADDIIESTFARLDLEGGAQPHGDLKP